MGGYRHEFDRPAGRSAQLLHPEDVAGYRARRPDREQPDVRRPRRVELQARSDRKSVVEGKSVSVRVDLGGRRIIKKKKIASDLRHTPQTLTDIETTTRDRK